MVKHELICVSCPIGCRLQVSINDQEWLIEGNGCKRGEVYARNELTAPKRVLTTTVRINKGFLKRLPVRTTEPIPKALIFEAMALINKIEVEAPVNMGDIILKDLLGTGISVIASRDMKQE